eukprot:350454-Chlamydomonas_euryale.AAC.10
MPTKPPSRCCATGRTVQCAHTHMHECMHGRACVHKNLCTWALPALPCTADWSSTQAQMKPGRPAARPCAHRGRRGTIRYHLAFGNADANGLGHSVGSLLACSAGWLVRRDTWVVGTLDAWVGAWVGCVSLPANSRPSAHHPARPASMSSHVPMADSSAAAACACSGRNAAPPVHALAAPRNGSAPPSDAVPPYALTWRPDAPASSARLSEARRDSSAASGHVPAHRTTDAGAGGTPAGTTAKLPLPLG